jgi:hypothetical protein
MEIQGGASRTKLIVEMVDRRVVLFADVAILWFDDFTKLRLALDFALFEGRWRENIWRGENGLASQPPDTCLRQHAFGPLPLLRLALA